MKGLEIEGLLVDMILAESGDEVIDGDAHFESMLALKACGVKARENGVDDDSDERVSV
jgi:hypothetical protein